MDFAKEKEKIKEIATKQLTNATNIKVEVETMPYWDEFAVTALVYFTRNGTDYVYHFAHADDDITTPYYSVAPTITKALAYFMESVDSLEMYGIEYVAEWKKNMIDCLISGFTSDAEHWLDEYDTNNEYELDTANIKDMAKEWAVNSFDEFLQNCEDKGIDPNDVDFDYSSCSEITGGFSGRNSTWYKMANAVTDWDEILDLGYVKKKTA